MAAFALASAYPPDQTCIIASVEGFRPSRQIVHFCNVHLTKSDDGSAVMALSATETVANIEDNPMVNRSVVGGDRRFLSQLVGLRFLWVLSIAFVSTLSFAQSPSPKSPTLKNDVPLNYVVQQGDTLWGISGVYLQEA